MNSYISNTPEEKKRMLEAIGIKSVEELLFNIPQNARYGGKKLGASLAEQEVRAQIQALADKNVPLSKRPAFLGGGAYRHFIPAAVDALSSRGEFLTAYTPYQPEASQGTLQATFEFQTLVCELYGMDAANASLYDGASALAEAALLALRHTGRSKVLIPENLHPEYAQVVAATLGQEHCIPLPTPKGKIDLESLQKTLDETFACVLVASPNFFGLLESGREIAAIVHAKGALLATTSNPIALGLFEAPGVWGADIATGEGQPLGIPVAYGGPYLGLFSVKEPLLRRMPGRIAGLTQDLNGRRAYVLTLQTREQHIRREKATSNICTNEALMSLRATIYLSLLGSAGLADLAAVNYHKAHALESALLAISGIKKMFNGVFFNEFAVELPIDAELVFEELARHGITGGLPLGRFYPAYSKGMLFCATEMTSHKDMQMLAAALNQILQREGAVS